MGTISGDLLVEVRDLMHSHQIWDRLHNWFLASSLAKTLELEQELTNLKKQKSQTMEWYLQEIKDIANSFAVINDPLTDQELM